MTSAPSRAGAEVSPAAPVAGLGTALVATGALAVLLGPAALLFGGGAGLTSVVVGVAVVAAFFCVGAGVVAFTASHIPTLALLVALLTYTLQVVLLAVVFAALDRSRVAEQLDRGWLAATVVTGALTWTAALVGHALRSVPRDTDPAAQEEEAPDGSPLVPPERATGTP